MTLGAHGFSIGIIVELDKLRTPENEHWMACVQNEPDRNPQALRPLAGIANRGFRPVMRSYQRAHLSTMGEKIKFIV